jgi:hypothetical protein
MPGLANASKKGLGSLTRSSRFQLGYHLRRVKNGTSKLPVRSRVSDPLADLQPAPTAAHRVPTNVGVDLIVGTIHQLQDHPLTNADVR